MDSLSCFLKATQLWFQRGSFCPIFPPKPLDADRAAPGGGRLTFRAPDDVRAEGGRALAEWHVLLPSWALGIHPLHLSCRNPRLTPVIALGCEEFTLAESRVSWYQKSTRVKTLTRKFNNFLWFYPSTIYKLESFKVNNLEKEKVKTSASKGSQVTNFIFKKQD